MIDEINEFENLHKYIISKFLKPKTYFEIEFLLKRLEHFFYLAGVPVKEENFSFSFGFHIHIPKKGKKVLWYPAVSGWNMPDAIKQEINNKINNNRNIVFDTIKEKYKKIFPNSINKKFLLNFTGDVEEEVRSVLKRNIYNQLFELGEYPKFIGQKREIYNEDFEISVPEDDFRKIGPEWTFEYFAVTVLESLFFSPQYIEYSTSKPFQCFKTVLYAKPVYLAEIEPIGDIFITFTYNTQRVNEEEKNFYISRTFKNKKFLRIFERELISLCRISYLQRIILSHALRSAVAAIMARNMSHNIGSHVLAYLQMEKIVELMARVMVKTNVNENIKCKTAIEIAELCSQIEISNSLEDKIQEIHNKLDNIKKGVIPSLVGDEMRWGLIEWVEDVKVFFQYLQHRMDFLAQVSTEWPEWTFSAYLMKDIMRNFLMQRHLLDGIAKSENLRGFYYDWEGPYKQYLNCRSKLKEGNVEDLGRIKIHIFNFAKMKEKDENLREKWFNSAEDSNNWSSQRKSQFENNDSKNNDSKRILLWSYEENTIYNTQEGDIQIAIPGGIVGYHAFYVILENIIRNAARHAYPKAKEKGIKDLEIFIEIIDDFEKPDEEWRVRIYDNVSFYKEVCNEVKPIINDDVKGPNEDLVAYINKCLRAPLIKETGELSKENWGLAEMKIVSGYLQKRKIEEVGAEGEAITGSGDPEKGDFIIRAINSPIKTLGFEFKLKKPKEVGIVCSNKEVK